MARNTGFMNRFLNFIGLVDDEPEQPEQQPAPRQRVSSASRASSRDSGSSVRFNNTYTAGTRPYASNGYAASFDRTASRVQPQAKPEPERDELEFDDPAPQKPRQQKQPPAQKQSSNVVPLKKPVTANNMQVIFCNLTTLEECREVIADLLDGKSVLLNLEEMDDRVVQRAIDTLGGAAFALNATLKRAADRTYLVAPKGIDISSGSPTHR